MACRRWHLVQVWFVGLCHICRGCSSSDRDTGETPVQRHTGSRGPVAPQSIRRSTSTFPDSSLGVHRSPLRRHDPRCVVTRPSRRLDFGSGLPHPDRVPLLPFLPAPAVCYAASRSEDPLVRWSAGLLHPAADHGVRHVSDSLTQPRSRASDPKVVDPKVHPGIFPCGEDPSKRSPPRQPSTMPSPRLVLSDAVAFTGWRSLSPFEPRPLACHHAALLRSRPQGFLPPRSPLRSWDVAIPRPLDAPLGFGSTRSRRCRAHRAAQKALDIPPGGPNRFGVPSPEREGKAGCFGPVWLLATGIESSPKGRPCAIAVAPAGLPKESPRPHPRRATKGMPVDLPRREVHRVGPHARRRSVSDVIATHLRRDSFATQSRSEERRPVVRAPSLRPSAVARVHDGETARRGHARPEACASARHSRAPRRMQRRTRLAKPEGLTRRASRRRHPEVGPWRLVTPTISSKLEVPAQGQTVVVLTGTAETRSEDEVSPPIRRSE
jgi:hypothetical protein